MSSTFSTPHGLSARCRPRGRHALPDVGNQAVSTKPILLSWERSTRLELVFPAFSFPFFSFLFILHYGHKIANIGRRFSGGLGLF